MLKFVFLFSIYYFLFSGAPVFAARFFWESTSAVSRGQTSELRFFLDTQGEKINTIGGVIVFPADLLELKDVSDGNSIINFWVEKPSTKTTATAPATAGQAGQDGQPVVFSGITPGGYAGDRGLVLTLTFEAKKAGAASIKLTNAKALLNDGQGSEAKTEITPFNMVVAEAGETPPPPSVVDNDPPESFAPELGRDLNIFEGKWFLVFATQDKGSGIDRYEAEERKTDKVDDGQWKTAESPYVLQDQTLGSYVFVKAVDKKGNQRVAFWAPQQPKIVWYKNYLIWCIIIAALFISLLGGMLWKKSRSLKI